ncbi:DUF2085 domain-containing protein [bacterium]|nr:DUF2085 domain-containing protein [bacterium]
MNASTNTRAGKISSPPATSEISRWSRTAYAVLLAAALLWTLGIFVAPALHASGNDAGALISRLFYAPVCHQQVERSFAVFSWPLSVCHRCSAIYVAFTLVLLAFPFLRRFPFFVSLPLSRLAIFILPMLLDYVLDVLGLWNNSGISRAISGSVAGAGLAIFVLPAWMEFWTARKRHHTADHKEVAE